jgi:hypothetical protein
MKRLAKMDFARRKSAEGAWVACARLLSVSKVFCALLQKGLGVLASLHERF